MSTISPPAPYSPAHRVVDEDADYEYYWSRGGIDFPIPRWLAEIVEVPLAVRLEIFLVGICTGLILGTLALLVGFYVTVG